MPEPMQGAVPRPPRAERTTTSCGECRRRKQKCSQGQPCSNCARRFPQPACEYKTSTRRPNAIPVPQRPAFAISMSPHVAPSSHGLSVNPVQSPSLVQNSPLLSPWDRRRSSQDVGQILPGWPGYGVVGQPSARSSSEQYAWSTDQQSLSTSVTACEDGCTLHSDEVHEAISMLQAYRSTQNHWAGSGCASGYSAWTLVPAMTVPEPGGIPWPAAGPTQELVQVPVAQAMDDTELLSIFVKFICQFTASLDGKPDASNPYIKYYVPYYTNSPLLVRVAIYSAACFLTDSGHVERTAAMAHKGRVITLLNEHIQSQPFTTDDVIAGVVQLVADEWLWGNTSDLRAHLRGLREMIRSRGGFGTLGQHNIISKHAISCDVAVALSFEAPPFLRGGPEFEFQDSAQAALRPALNTPLVSTLAPFSSCYNALDIHPSVASILDDMRFLLSAVLALPDNPTPKELRKVHTTSAWIHERISSLPEDSPAARRLSATTRVASSPTLPAFSGTFENTQQLQPARVHSRSPHPQIPTQPNQAPAHGQPQVPSHSPRAPPATGDQPEQVPDYVYQAVRQAAQLYSRAIMHRQPFSLVVTPAEFLRLWTTAWRVPLSTWRSLLGVFNWILLPLLPSGRAVQPHDRFVKGMMNISLFQIGLDNWEIARSVMEAGLSLQRWLAGDAREPAGPSDTGSDANEKCPWQGGEAQGSG